MGKTATLKKSKFWLVNAPLHRPSMGFFASAIHVWIIDFLQIKTAGRLCATVHWQNWNPGSWCLALCRFEDQSFHCTSGKYAEGRIFFFSSSNFSPISIPKQQISVFLKERLPKNNCAVVTKTKALITFLGLLSRSHNYTTFIMQINGLISKN